MKDDFLDLGDEPGSKHLLNASIAVPSEILLHPHDFQKNVVHFFCVTVQVLYLNLVLPSASDRWNCNSLGRDKMPYAEALFLRDNGFDHAAVRKIGAVFSDDGGVDPYVVMCSDKGKMLHFNGGVKPWTWQTYYADHKLPLCALPENMPENFNFNSVVQVKLFCKLVSFVNCVDIWNSFISEETACALRDYKQEWPEEPTWIANMGEKVAKEEEERIDREKARIQKQEGLHLPDDSHRCRLCVDNLYYNI
ncbi:unnamed protein product [Cladocopium goreaui]|uniref:Galacturonosyltransferase-like 10 n=1 Tax=Cladocopium goreaui TaxID=2562237 RepID=A0A9P1FG03_9DINO|nr:unnamed protein product [Cladocopium goreaui]